MSLEDYNIQSGDDYADLLIENLKAYDGLTDELPDDLMKYWAKEIRKFCNDRYELYIKNKVDNYLLTDDDILVCYKEASLKMTGDILAELVDKGEVKMGINDQGEFVYSAKDWDMVREKKRKK
jgi:hypothetical protein